jgi:hypothetical protein
MIGRDDAGFDHMVEARGSKIVWMRISMGSNEWKRETAYLLHRSRRYGGGATTVDLNWKLGSIGTVLVRKSDWFATVHSESSFRVASACKR